MLPIEQCYGFIVVFKEHENMFLILERKETKADWTFAKGHMENGESPKETALRELEEETGIKEIEVLDINPIHEEYEIVRNGEKRLKINDYFIGFVGSKEVEIQEDEIRSYKWVTFEEAFNSFKYERRKQVLKTAQEYLKNIVK